MYGGFISFCGSRAGFYRPETVCHEKILFKIKSIVMQKKIDLFRKYNIIHILRGDLLSLNENRLFWIFFIIFNILNVSVG